MNHIQRLKELWLDGGVQEVKRGIRDYIYTETSIPVHRLYTTREMDCVRSDVSLKIESNECLWRATGNGETGILRDFERVVRTRHDCTVWDIGSNIGTYALVAGYSGADVVAFEPGDTAFTRLCRNISLNGLRDRVIAERTALSNEETRKILSDEPGHTGGRTISDHGESNGDVVTTARGDTFTEYGSPDVIKIDVEGHEIEVLQGLENTLPDVDTVFIEIHRGVPRMRLYTLLWDAGFTKTTEWNDRTNETHFRFDKQELEYK
jgi:FkbM family methyltransferase